MLKQEQTDLNYTKSGNDHSNGHFLPFKYPVIGDIFS